MRHLILPAAMLTAGPAFAATGEYGFFTLRNTDFVVLIGFIVFLAILLYFKVPGMLAGMLDKRAEGIRSELDEARGLREEAQALLASFERKQKETQAQADRIVAHAREEAERAAEAAKEDMRDSVDRRMAAAESQIASAEAKAVREVRDRAITVAIAAARDVVSQQMTQDESARLIDRSIDEVGDKLH
ncbi:F0F1 ATP synthase subunit B [Citreimonas salinaria]|uniref:ATP synthase subunit b n=1 Tax=Citreimonas salinaria TaxID=321339 RepID=A0A1H3FF77_9RHOB|nr:F0F1 ATP synthase subunit B [Citreimonas salinaria]SDX89590.1 F-type H+-transporting ATPase subunit b [Citreimonas salinaria]